MNSSKIRLYLIALLLTIVGLGMTLYKHFELGFPLLPGAKSTVWTVEGQISFNTDGGPSSASLALPAENNGFQILHEDYAASGYGFFLSRQGEHRRAEWSARDIQGPQTLYYNLQLSRKSGSDTEAPALDEAPEIPRVDLDEPDLTAAQAVVALAKQQSSDARSFTYQLLQALISPDPSQDVRVLQKRGKISTSRIVDLLHLGGIPAREVRGLYLEDKRRNQNLVNMLEIHDGEQWRVFDPYQAQEGLPENFLLWQQGGISLLDVIGGTSSKVSFSISANSTSARGLALQTAANEKAALIDFSIYSLPIAEQNAFKTILLVPIGTLIVVFLRVLIGIRTSGTFMPILMALAFMQTSLITGLIIFVVVVSIGLWIRSTLSHLNLLLVARISSVVIVVIGIMAGLSIISYKLGINQLLTVTLFPMIILSWTIERMSVLWEEEGPKEVVVQGFGSLLVASLAYLVMTNSLVEHLTFNFPELLFVILALNLLLGQYTGYRLTELARFQPLAARGTH